MEREEIRKKEFEFLLQEYKKSPQLFRRETLIEGPEFLKNFGIFIENQENFPKGYLKLWPQDFIVEEIGNEGEKETVYLEPLLKIPFFEEKATIYATLVKCNISTIEAQEELSRKLNLPKEKIQFAGIKDKRALSAQKISIRETSFQEIQEITSSYFFLKNIYFGKGVVEKGKIAGNEFTILVRTTKDFNEEIFWENLKKIQKEGFYNFYYLQRFATPRLINYFWGLLILKGEYEKAVLSFLSDSGEKEIPYFKNLRKKIKENFGSWEKIEEILNPLPLMFKNELKIVSYLKNHPTDFVGALSQIPQQITLWVFALSSWLFNYKLSALIKTKKPIPEKLPLFLSFDKNDWKIYENFLSKLGIYPPPFENLKPFPFIQIRKREIKTKEKAQIKKVKIVKEGVILNFFLPKGVYATTFLCHLFRLLSGPPPKEIQQTPIDLKESLGEKSLRETLNYFQDVISPQSQNIFEKEI